MPLPLRGKVSFSIAHRWSPPSRALCLVAFDPASCCHRTCYDPPPVNVLEDDSVMIRPLTAAEAAWVVYVEERAVM